MVIHVFMKFHEGTDIPLELHKVRVVQKLYLHPIENRLQAIRKTGFNGFLLNMRLTG